MPADIAKIAHGVAFNPPPTAMVSGILKLVEQQATHLTPGHGTFMADVETNKGWNMVVAHKVNDRWVVGAYVGKDWGQKLTGAAMVRGSW